MRGTVWISAELATATSVECRKTLQSLCLGRSSEKRSAKGLAGMTDFRREYLVELPKAIKRLWFDILSVFRPLFTPKRGSLRKQRNEKGGENENRKSY